MATYVPLPSSKRSLLANSRAIGPVDRSETASLTIRVRSMGDKKALEQWVNEQSKLPLDQRKYLTHEELAKQHGADSADLDLVEELSQRHNLVVVHRSEAERSIVLKGKLGDLLDAFPADVQMYHHSSGTYRGRQGEIQIPEHLDQVVTGIFGFDTRPKHRLAHRHATLAASGPGGQNGMAATEFATRYHFPTQFQGTKLDGGGQTVAIIELGGGFRTSDLRVFFHEIGVPTPKVSAVSVDHAKNHPSTADSDDGEVMLDIRSSRGSGAEGQVCSLFRAEQRGPRVHQRDQRGCARCGAQTECDVD